jgi:hypothetical protein
MLDQCPFEPPRRRRFVHAPNHRRPARKLTITDLLSVGTLNVLDPNDALSTAIAALRGRRLRPVQADDHMAILRMLGDRHNDLTALRTQAVCRLKPNWHPLSQAEFPLS